MIASSRPVFRVLTLTAALVLPMPPRWPRPSPPRPPSRLRRPTADYIVAVVNNELVTEVEVQQRMAQLAGEASATRRPCPTRRPCASRPSTV
jgi:peptidyl-prolyl cis-trans isomerase SurA